MLINATSWASTAQGHFLQETENGPNPRDRNRAFFLCLLSHGANRKVSNSFLKHCRKRFESETPRTHSTGWQKKIKQSFWYWVVFPAIGEHLTLAGLDIFSPTAITWRN